jgi:transposase
MSNQRGAFTAEFRQQMVELYLAGRSCNSLSKEFGCGSSTIASWVKQAGSSTSSSKPSPVSSGALIQGEREELARLRKRVRQLETERDILSKATAWFANNGAATPTGSTRS